ncbi:hypothetical protein ATCV1_z510L [Acanthocystis turfacea chlorella virus 1]|uniref:Uncharacterized protein z510L n=1 Tax=Chlorovirus heliozoae TaxID=322019 RepID=A7K9C0_9PHYC|nr:hypothetical protein ATCV1_z510L [Acanthocystis turfacea chlorella virus 1]ABT16644.1 hypothetical protein ATCV1_z510L [Acanthocystis turfacea chlorella virus 1]
MPRSPTRGFLPNSMPSRERHRNLQIRQTRPLIRYCTLSRQKRRQRRLKAPPCLTSWSRIPSRERQRTKMPQQTSTWRY